MNHKQRIRLFSLVVLAAGMMTACSSTPSVCECQSQLMAGVLGALTEGMSGEDVDTSDLEELAEKCEEAYSDLSAAELAEEMAKCND